MTAQIQEYPDQTTLTPAVVSERLNEITAGFNGFIAPLVSEKGSQHEGAVFEMLLAELQMLSNQLKGFVHGDNQ